MPLSCAPPMIRAVAHDVGTAGAGEIAHRDAVVAAHAARELRATAGTDAVDHASGSVGAAELRARARSRSSDSRQLPFAVRSFDQHGVAVAADVDHAQADEPCCARR